MSSTALQANILGPDLTLFNLREPGIIGCCICCNLRSTFPHFAKIYVLHIQADWSVSMLMSFLHGTKSVNKSI